MQQIPIWLSKVWTDHDSNPRSTALMRFPNLDRIWRVSRQSVLSIMGIWKWGWTVEDRRTEWCHMTYFHFTTQISKRFASYRHFDRGNSGWSDRGIKPENDRKAEGFTWPIFIFAVLEVSIVSKIGRLSVSMGVEMVRIYKNVFFLKKNHFTTQISKR
jgi:hypothetical protein